MHRVLRPGGRLVILEITQPTPAAALDLLLALVRPDRAGARSRWSATPTPTPTCPSRCAASRARAGLAEKMDAAGLERIRWTAPRRGDHRDPQRRPRPVTRHSAVPPPVTAVLDASSRWLPAQLGGSRRCCASRAGGHGEAACRRRRDDPARQAASGCGRCWSCSARARRPATPRCGRRRRSSWCTWRPSSTTTCSTRRRCAAAEPTVAATAGRDRATATGDLLFSRAFALLAAPRELRAIELLSAASVALARGELAQRRDAYDIVGLRAALPGALPPEDGEPVRMRLPAGTRRAGAGRIRRRDRTRLPVARRRPRRRRAAGADRKGARHRPARRHRHPAAGPRRGVGSRDPRDRPRQP